MRPTRTNLMCVKDVQLSGKWFKDLESRSLARLISTAADVALVVDKNGFIRDLACESDALPKKELEEWVGQRWTDTVTVESRTKIEDLLQSASTGKSPAKWRQVNHPTSKFGPDIPVKYSAFSIGDQGRIVAFGRELTSSSQLQQRLVESQQAAEREYTRIRMTERRYRALFQVSSEAVIIVDGNSLKIVEANAAAVEFLGLGPKKILDRSVFDIVSERSISSLERLLDSASNSPEAAEKRVSLAKGGTKCLLNASLFKQDRGSFFLIRLIPTAGKSGTSQASKSDSHLWDIVGLIPDGFVVTDTDRRIVTANAAFVELTDLASEDQVKGQLLERWIGQSRVDVDILFANLREHGSVNRFTTVLEGELGSSVDVEISAVAISETDKPYFGFTVRTIRRDSVNADRMEQSLPRSVQQMTELVGRVPLKDLIRDTTDIIERLCIEAALELTDDNRASAAEILGLSRQSLYVKLRRYGMVDSDLTDLN